MNPSVFPDPHRFRPERWLEAAAEGRNLDKYFVPFGKGTRQCPGMKCVFFSYFPLLPHVPFPPFKIASFKHVLMVEWSTCTNGKWSTNVYSLAYAEMFLAATMMVRRFDWDMYETGLGDVECKHDHFVAVGDLDSKGVRATLRLRE